jgi:hypothetical protein
MQPEGITMQAEKPRRKRTKSRAVKTRLLSMTDLDNRTRAYQVAQETKAAIIADLGGRDRLSTLELLQIENVSVDAAVLRDMQVRWLKGDKVLPTEIATMENVFNRTAAALGTQRRAKDATPTLDQVLRDHAAQEPAAHAEEGERDD